MARGHAPLLPPGATPPLHLSGSRALANGPSGGTASRADRTRLGRGLECQPNLVAVRPPASFELCSGMATSANRECLAAVTAARTSLTVVRCRASSDGAPSAPFGDTPAPPPVAWHLPPSYSSAPVSPPSSDVCAPPPPPYCVAPTSNVMHREHQRRWHSMVVVAQEAWGCGGSGGGYHDSGGGWRHDGDNVVAEVVSVFLFSLNKCLSSVTSSTRQKFSECPTFDTRQSSLHRVLSPQVLFASATLGIYFAKVFYAAFSEHCIVVAQLW
jgi:hypothetical protein